jgi:predicted deacetylase
MTNLKTEKNPAVVEIIRKAEEKGEELELHA